MRVWFQKCECGIFREPHGYFYDAVQGRCPIATMTMESAEVALKGIAEIRELSTEEVAAIRRQIKDINMSQRCGSDEYVAALFVVDWFK
jgi:hypothetical protein